MWRYAMLINNSDFKRTIENSINEILPSPIPISIPKNNKYSICDYENNLSTNIPINNSENCEQNNDQNNNQNDRNIQIQFSERFSKNDHLKYILKKWFQNKCNKINENPMKYIDLILHEKNIKNNLLTIIDEYSESDFGFNSNNNIQKQQDYGMSIMHELLVYDLSKKLSLDDIKYDSIIGIIKNENIEYKILDDDSLNPLKRFKLYLTLKYESNYIFPNKIIGFQYIIERLNNYN